MPKFTGTKPTVSGKKISKSNASSTKSKSKASSKKGDTPRFGLCIDNKKSADLQIGKTYRLLPDSRAKSEDYVRVIDDSGEDYLYPAAYFRILRLPRPIAMKLARRLKGV